MMSQYKNYEYSAIEWNRELLHILNGYVRIPEHHPLYAEINQISMWDAPSGTVHEHRDFDIANKHIDIHGGFTFAEQITQADIDRGRWLEGQFIPGLWIGWDYAHMGDCFWDHEQQKTLERIGVSSAHHPNGFNDKHWTLPEVAKDCKQVIDQLIAYKKLFENKNTSGVKRKK